MSNKCGFYSFINEADDKRNWVRCFQHNVLIERDIHPYGSYCVPGGDSHVIHRLVSECQAIRSGFIKVKVQKREFISQTCDFKLSIYADNLIGTNPEPLWHKAYCRVHKVKFHIDIEIKDGKLTTASDSRLEQACYAERNK